MITNSNKMLKIIHAGALERVIEACLERFHKQNPELIVKTKAVGSREGAKLFLSGEYYDIIALADHTLFAEFLVPDLVENYFVFASDQMVIAYDRFSEGSQQINSENWTELLLKPQICFAHSNHHLDPCGYRALMVWQLAERFYNKPGLHTEMEAACLPYSTYAKSLDLAKALSLGKVDYAFLYASQAAQLGLPHIILPSKINLSNPAYAEYYDQAAVAVESKLPGNKIIMHGKPIEFAVGLAKNSPYPELTQSFVDYLTGPEGTLILEDCGLIPC